MIHRRHLLPPIRSSIRRRRLTLHRVSYQLRRSRLDQLTFNRHLRQRRDRPCIIKLRHLQERQHTISNLRHQRLSQDHLVNFKPYNPTLKLILFLKCFSLYLSLIVKLQVHHGLLSIAEQEEALFSISQAPQKCQHALHACN